MFPLLTQENTISNLKKKNQDLGKLRFVLDCQLDDLRKQVEPQQEDISRKKGHIQQVCVCVCDHGLSSNRQQRTAVQRG